MTVSLLKVKPIVDANYQVHLSELWQQLSKVIPDDYFDLCTVDIACGVSFNYVDFKYPKALGTEVKLHQQ